jgi:hypothetical protein
MPVLRQMVEYAKSSGKSGVSAFGDMGSFFYENKENGLMEYELSLPSEYDNEMNLKTFCLYHQKDFDKIYRETKAFSNFPLGSFFVFIFVITIVKRKGLIFSYNHCLPI